MAWRSDACNVDEAQLLVLLHPEPCQYQRWKHEVQHRWQEQGARSRKGSLRVARHSSTSRLHELFRVQGSRLTEVSGCLVSMGIW